LRHVKQGPVNLAYESPPASRADAIPARLADFYTSKSIRQAARSADIRQGAQIADSVLHSTDAKISAQMPVRILDPKKSAPARDRAHRGDRYGDDDVLRDNHRGRDSGIRPPQRTEKPIAKLPLELAIHLQIRLALHPASLRCRSSVPI